MKALLFVLLSSLSSVGAKSQLTEIIHEDFSTDKWNWTVSVEELTAKVDAGKYNVYNPLEDFIFSRTIPAGLDSSKSFSVSLTTSFIEVNMVKNKYSMAGLIFCAGYNSSYYFIITDTYGWLINEVKNGTSKTLAVGKSKNINVSPGAGNRMKVNCVPGAWEYYINDSLFFRQTSTGNFGQSFGVLCNSTSRVSFDDLVISGTALKFNGKVCDFINMVYMNGYSQFDYITSKKIKGGGGENDDKIYKSYVSLQNDTSASIFRNSVWTEFSSQLKSFKTNDEAKKFYTTLYAELKNCMKAYTVMDYEGEISFWENGKYGRYPQGKIKIEKKVGSDGKTTSYNLLLLIRKSL